MEKVRGFTWEVPWLGFVDVNNGDGVQPERLAGDLALEVVANEFFVGRVESEPGSE